ncbi:DNA polymerase III subunit beta [Amycolatopsis sp. H20-H5]|uniref:DNA polymerase III subunit beta n=1 Tax=Amycolatopsis sp. H20-H5 TaxID=3046309 RepID=UPI002DB90334|nr:DNA polymerase III subunit beta [Amycolatopsis sp. H20-H5]MEC3974337.1 DNA polymerase III subunit beta [Amycolatopsis sp. H20-H5]
MTITADTPTTTRTSSVARMGFTTDRATLADALTTVGLAISKRPVVPMLGGALLQARDGHLTITGTDYDTTVTVRLPGTVDTPGTLLLDHGELTKLLGALVKGTRKRDADALAVTVRTLDNGTPVVDLAGYTMPVTDFPAEEYPTMPGAGPTVAQVDRDTFARDMARVMVAVGTDDALPMLTGVHLDIAPGAVTMAGTDRYRLAMAPLPAVSTTGIGETVAALIPGHLVAPVVKRFTGDRVRIGLDDSTNPGVVSLTCGHVTVSVRTIDAVFPPYRQLIPGSAAGVIQTDRAALLAATQRAAAVLDAKRQRGGQVIVTFTGTSVSVAPALEEHADTVTAPEQPATVDGVTSPERFWFSPAFFADALTSFTGDTITLHTQASVHRPVLLTDAADGLTTDAAFRHLIMPVRSPGN